MTQGPQESPTGPGWIRIVGTLAATAILIGMINSGNVEVFGLSMSPVLVGVVLYFLGLFAGLFTSRPTR